MSADSKIWQLAEGYVNGSLTDTEQFILQDKLATDVSFKAEFNESVNLLRSLKGSGQHKQFRGMLQDIAQTGDKKKARIISLPVNYRTAAIAASIAFIISIGTYWITQYNNNKKIASQYILLRKDLEKYKRSQNALISDIKNQQAPPVEPARYTGTGFALTNDGYFVTNYHVIEGADSVYIQNDEGEYYKSSLISFNAKTDIALLKVEHKKFRFGKGDVPYSLSPSKRDLGTKVYTIGFPEDEMVYYEGYISSINGYEGDSAQYRLELPSEHGLSGAPVADASGNIIGIITGKKTESQGTTYAVSSAELLEMMESLPDGINLKLPKTNKLGAASREQQIKKLGHYTCAVKVYKN